MPKPSKINYDTLSIIELNKFLKRGDILLISEATIYSYEYVRSVIKGNRGRNSEAIRRALVQFLKDRDVSIQNIKKASENV